MKSKLIAIASCLVVTLGVVNLGYAQPAEKTDGTVAKTVDAGKQAVGVAVETGKNIAEGVGEAGSEIGTMLKTGSSEVIEQGRNLWQDAVLPMLQKILAALPIIIKAVIILIGFWLVARLLGACVTKLLGLTNLDDRAAKDWGMSKLIEGKDGKGTSLEKICGGLVKWIILLLGFVAFFNALNLQMVAGPLQNVVDEITRTIPNLLKAIAILFTYWIVATLIKCGIVKGLEALNFDERASRFFPAREIKGEMVGPSALIGRLAFYIILLLGITPFLQALGQEALVEPLQKMFTDALAFIPRIVGAIIIVSVGMLVSTIVKEVLTNFLAATGADAGADKLGFGKIFGEKKLSGIVGVISYFFIIVPVIVSALAALQIKAISDPLTKMMEGILLAIPAILVATIIIGVGYVIANLISKLTTGFLSGIGFDQLPAKIGLDYLAPKEGRDPLSVIIGKIVMVIIMLLTAQQALAKLEFHQLSGLVDEIIRYLPQLLVGLVILFAALSLGKYVGNLVAKATEGSGHAKILSKVAQYVIVFLGVSMALEQLGVGEAIVSAAVTSVLGGTALALGLAFGLGGKDRAKELIDKSKTE